MGVYSGEGGAYQYNELPHHHDRRQHHYPPHEPEPIISLPQNTVTVRSGVGMGESPNCGEAMQRRVRDVNTTATAAATAVFAVTQVNNLLGLNS